MFRLIQSRISGYCALLTILNLTQCSSGALAQDEIKPLVVTKPVQYDPDDPAIWIDKRNPAQSLIIATDKGKDGALYVFNMEGEILTDKVIKNLDRPNNVDIAYSMILSGKQVDIAVTTERSTGKLRVFSVPEMLSIDNGGIKVFEGETRQDYDAPMGVALFKSPNDNKVYAVVSRKSGPVDNTYLWQYLLKEDGQGNITGTLIRKFGKYSGNGEIESVAVDNELGYIYYSDEKLGVRKYYADPAKGNEELAIFATKDFKEDREGISIYKIDDGTGYILVSDQKANQLHIFSREGTPNNPHDHQLLKKVKIEAKSSDGSELVNFPILPNFSKGVFVAMSDNKTFHLYRWEDIAGTDLRIQPPGLGIPVAPTLISPANNSSGVAISTTINWNVQADATHYKVEISKTQDFSTVVFDQKNITSTSVQLNGLTGNSIYYWRVRAFNATGNSKWSSIWKFTTTAPTGALVGHWEMDEGRGTTLIDATTYGNNATITGNVDWFRVDTGRALKLNGLDQYATVPDSPSLNITKAITLAAWIKPKQKATQSIIRKGIQGKTDGYELSLSNKGQVFFRINHASSNDIYRLNSLAIYPRNGQTWMHIAATFDSKVIKIYINGVENNTLTLPTPIVININNSALAIGGQSDGSYLYKGAIDDARVYNTALNSIDIGQLARIPPTPSPFIAAFLPTIQTTTLIQETQVYPNPFQNKTTVNFTLPRGGSYEASLYNSSGVLVRNIKQDSAAPGEQNTVEVIASNLLPGLYFLQLKTPGDRKILKLVIVK